MARRRTRGPSLSFFAFQDIITAVVGIFILITIILILELVQRVEVASAGVAEPTKPIVDAANAIEDEVKRLRDELETRNRERAEVTELNSFNREEKFEQLQDRIELAERRIRTAEEQIRATIRERETADADRARLEGLAGELEAKRREIDDLNERERELKRRFELLAEDASEIFRDRLDDGRYLLLITLTGSEIVVRDAMSKSSQTYRGSRRLSEFEEWLDGIGSARRHVMIRVQPGGAGDYESLKATFDRGDWSFGFTVVGADDSVRIGFELEQQP